MKIKDQHEIKSWRKIIGWSFSILHNTGLLIFMIFNVTDKLNMDFIHIDIKQNKYFEFESYKGWQNI